MQEPCTYGSSDPANSYSSCFPSDDDDDVESIISIPRDDPIPDDPPAEDLPADVNEYSSTPIELPNLLWHGYCNRPKAFTLKNTGNSILINGVWGQGRPYLSGGPFNGTYIFSHIHFHIPSEHVLNRRRYPMELHAVHYKSAYLTQERAMRKKDGTMVVVYFFEVEGQQCTVMSGITKVLSKIKKKNCKVDISDIYLGELMKPFCNNYFIYWGSAHLEGSTHKLQWVINCRRLPISSEELGDLQDFFCVQDCVMRKAPIRLKKIDRLYLVGDTINKGVGRHMPEVRFAERGKRTEKSKSCLSMMRTWKHTAECCRSKDSSEERGEKGRMAPCGKCGHTGYTTEGEIKCKWCSSPSHSGQGMDGRTSSKKVSLCTGEPNCDCYRCKGKMMNPDANVVDPCTELFSKKETFKDDNSCSRIGKKTCQCRDVCSGQCITCSSTGDRREYVGSRGDRSRYRDICEREGSSYGSADSIYPRVGPCRSEEYECPHESSSMERSPECKEPRKFKCTLVCKSKKDKKEKKAKKEKEKKEKKEKKKKKKTKKRKKKSDGDETGTSDEDDIFEPKKKKKKKEKKKKKKKGEKSDSYLDDTTDGTTEYTTSGETTDEGKGKRRGKSSTSEDSSRGGGKKKPKKEKKDKKKKKDYSDDEDVGDDSEWGGDYSDESKAKGKKGKEKKKPEKAKKKDDGKKKKSSQDSKSSRSEDDSDYSDGKKKKKKDTGSSSRSREGSTSTEGSVKKGKASKDKGDQMKRRKTTFEGDSDTSGKKSQKKGKKGSRDGSASTEDDTRQHEPVIILAPATVAEKYIDSVGTIPHTASLVGTPIPPREEAVKPEVNIKSEKSKEPEEDGERKKDTEPEEDREDREPEEDRGSEKNREPEEDRRSDKSREPEEDTRSDKSREPEEDRSDKNRDPEEDRRSDKSREPEEDRRSDKSREPEEDRRSDKSREPEEDRRSNRSREPEEDRRSDKSREPEEDRRSEKNREPEEDRRSDKSREPEEDRRSDKSRGSERSREPEEDRRSDKSRGSERGREPEEDRRSVKSRGSERSREPEEDRRSDKSRGSQTSREPEEDRRSERSRGPEDDRGSQRSRELEECTDAEEDGKKDDRKPSLIMSSSKAKCVYPVRVMRDMSSSTDDLAWKARLSHQTVVELAGSEPQGVTVIGTSQALIVGALGMQKLGTPFIEVTEPIMVETSVLKVFEKPDSMNIMTCQREATSELKVPERKGSDIMSGDRISQEGAVLQEVASKKLSNVSTRQEDKEGEVVKCTGNEEKPSGDAAVVTTAEDRPDEGDREEAIEPEKETTPATSQKGSLIVIEPYPRPGEATAKDSSPAVSEAASRTSQEIDRASEGKGSPGPQKRLHTRQPSREVRSEATVVPKKISVRNFCSAQFCPKVMDGSAGTRTPLPKGLSSGEASPEVRSPGTESPTSSPSKKDVVPDEAAVEGSEHKIPKKGSEGDSSQKEMFSDEGWTETESPGLSVSASEREVTSRGFSQESLGKLSPSSRGSGVSQGAVSRGQQTPESVSQADRVLSQGARSSCEASPAVSNKGLPEAESREEFPVGENATEEIFRGRTTPGKVSPALSRKTLPEVCSREVVVADLTEELFLGMNMPGDVSPDLSNRALTEAEPTEEIFSGTSKTSGALQRESSRAPSEASPAVSNRALPGAECQETADGDLTKELFIGMRMPGDASAASSDRALPEAEPGSGEDPTEEIFSGTTALEGASPGDSNTALPGACSRESSKTPGDASPAPPAHPGEGSTEEIFSGTPKGASPAGSNKALPGSDKPPPGDTTSKDRSGAASPDTQSLGGVSLGGAPSKKSFSGADSPEVRSLDRSSPVRGIKRSAYLKHQCSGASSPGTRTPTSRSPGNGTPKRINSKSSSCGSPGTRSPGNAFSRKSCSPDWVSFGRTTPVKISADTFPKKPSCDGAVHGKLPQKPSPVADKLGKKPSGKGMMSAPVEVPGRMSPGRDSPGAITPGRTSLISRVSLGRISPLNKPSGEMKQEQERYHVNFESEVIPPLETLVIDTERPEVEKLHRQEDLNESIKSRRSTETGRSADDDMSVESCKKKALVEVKASDEMQLEPMPTASERLDSQPFEEYYVRIEKENSVLQEYTGKFDSSEILPGNAVKLRLLPKSSVPIDDINVEMEDCIIRFDSKEMTEQLLVEAHFLVGRKEELRAADARNRASQKALQIADNPSESTSKIVSGSRKPPVYFISEGIETDPTTGKKIISGRFVRNPDSRSALTGNPSATKSKTKQCRIELSPKKRRSSSQPRSTNWKSKTSLDDFIDDNDI